MQQPSSLLLLLLITFASASNGVFDSAASDAATHELFAAARADDAGGVAAALAAGARIDERRAAFAGSGLATPLMVASLGGGASAVLALLRAGADPTIGEKDGYTPLHGAGFQGRAAVAAVLLADARVPHQAHSDGYLPLHRACWGREARHADTVEVFLRNGAKHDARSARGETPLDLARRSGNRRSIELLEKASEAAVEAGGGGDL